MAFSLFLFLAVIVARISAPESNFGKLIQFILSPEQYKIELQELEKKPTES